MGRVLPGPGHYRLLTGRVSAPGSRAKSVRLAGSHGQPGSAQSTRSPARYLGAPLTAVEVTSRSIAGLHGEIGQRESPESVTSAV